MGTQHDRDATPAEARSGREKQESGMPGGGQGRRDETGRSGVYPASAPEGAASSAGFQGEASWGQGERGAAGYADSGGSELTTVGDEKAIGGLGADAAGRPTAPAEGQGKGR